GKFECLNDRSNQHGLEARATNMQFVIEHSYLIPLLPLIGAAIAGFGCTGPRKHLAHWPIWIGVGISAVMSFVLLFGMLVKMPHGHDSSIAGTAEGLSYSKHWYTWITTGNFTADAGAFFDPLTAVMLCVVCGIGWLITVFAAGYMKGEEGYFRFFSYLGLFIFAMTCLVMG